MKSKRDIEKREDRITYLANKKIDRIEQKRGSKLEGKEIIDVFDDAEKYVKAKDKAKRQKQKQRRKLRNKIIAILGALGITIGGGHALLTSGETQDANIYGYGFDDFYCSDSGVENIEIEQTEKPNILIIHGNIDGSTIEDMQYNSMSKKMLQEKGFDYVALGHIHKKDYNTEEDQKIVYPGSTISLGFDELGEHGMIVGDVEKNKLETQFIKLDDKQFTKRELNVDNIYSKEELIEKINELEIEENNYVEIILIGNRNFEINKYDLIKYILNNNIIKIKDNTKIAYNLEKLENENTLKGLFIKEMNKKLKNAETEEEKEIIEKSIEIGLASLE